MPISISPNGPYVVTALPLSRKAIAANAADESTGWVDLETIETPARYFLCRCGLSAKKPYCDKLTTACAEFDGTETASREPYAAQAEMFDGPAVAMLDAPPLCAFARFCDRDLARGGGRRDRGRGFPATAALTAQIGQCPSGRLKALDKAADRPVEPKMEPQVFLIEDPLEQCSGPIFVGGGVEIVGSDGVAWETRNRVTLCRCGASKNKPFCDGSHAEVKFRDGSSPAA